MGAHSCTIALGREWPPKDLDDPPMDRSYRGYFGATTNVDARAYHAWHGYDAGKARACVTLRQTRLECTSTAQLASLRGHSSRPLVWRGPWSRTSAAWPGAPRTRARPIRQHRARRRSR